MLLHLSIFSISKPARRRRFLAAIRRDGDPLAKRDKSGLILPSRLSALFPKSHARKADLSTYRHCLRGNEVVAFVPPQELRISADADRAKKYRYPGCGSEAVFLVVRAGVNQVIAKMPARGGLGDYAMDGAMPLEAGKFGAETVGLCVGRQREDYP